MGHGDALCHRPNTHTPAPQKVGEQEVFTGPGEAVTFVPFYDEKKFRYPIAPDQLPLHFLGTSDPQNTLGHAMPGEGGAINAYVNLGPGGPDGFHDRSRDNLLVRIVNGRIE